MSSTVRFQATWSWTDADGNTFTQPTKTVLCPYSTVVQGSIPVAQGLASGVEVDLPFLGIVTAATFVYVENLSGQELGMAWGGNFSPNLPNGDILMHTFTVQPGAGLITSLRFFLTQVQAAPGRIVYLVAGT